MSHPAPERGRVSRTPRKSLGSAQAAGVGIAARSWHSSEQLVVSEQGAGVGGGVGSRMVFAAVGGEEGELEGRHLWFAVLWAGLFGCSHETLAAAFDAGAVGHALLGLRAETARGGRRPGVGDAFVRVLAVHAQAASIQGVALRHGPDDPTPAWVLALVTAAALTFTIPVIHPLRRGIHDLIARTAAERTAGD